MYINRKNRTRRAALGELGVWGFGNTSGLKNNGEEIQRLFKQDGNYSADEISQLRVAVGKIADWGTVTGGTGQTDRGGEIGRQPAGVLHNWPFPTAEAHSWVARIKQQRPDLFSDRKGDFLSRAVETIIPAIVITGITAGVGAAAGLGPLASGGAAASPASGAASAAAPVAASSAPAAVTASAAATTATTGVSAAGALQTAASYLSKAKDIYGVVNAIHSASSTPNPAAPVETLDTSYSGGGSGSGGGAGGSGFSASKNSMLMIAGGAAILIAALMLTGKRKLGR